MRRSLLLLCCALVGMGCGRATVTAPEPTSIEAPTYALVSGGESLVAMFDLTIDPATLTATVTPIRSAATQPPQAISYDLDIANFLEGDTFRIESIEEGVTGDFFLAFTHAHPFNAPNFANPITAQNRADLSYTGRVLFLATGTPRSFFSNSVVVDPDLLLFPDGYVQPGNLLDTSINPHNTFPYKLLVNEAFDNRIGVTNSGDPAGNYNPSLGGWQRSNAGAEGNGWTGYDYLHAGQQTTTVAGINGDRMRSGSVSMQIAIVIKYTDPRGTGNRNFRFPFEPVDTLQFAYRLPFAALDASKVNTTNFVDFGDFAGSARTLHIDVRDWDVSATEAADANLADETDPSLVPPGTNGAPVVSVDMPNVSATPFASSTLSGGGLPGDELDYGINVTNALDPGPGDYFGFAKIEDPENLVNRSTYHFGVDPVTLAPTRTRLNIVTYQVVHYTVGGYLPEISSVSPTGELGLPGASVTFTASHIGATSVLWNFGRGAIPGTSTSVNPTVMLDEPGTHSGTLVVSNARGSSEPFLFTYTVTYPSFPNFPAHAVGMQNPVNPFIVMKNGRPAVFFATTAASPHLIFLARANVAAPTSGADWSIHSTGLLSVAEIGFGPILTAGVQQDRFILVNNAGGIGVADVSEPVTDTDWSLHLYDSIIDGGYGPTLAVLPDRLMIAAYHRGQGGGDEQDARISWSNVALPLNGAAWTHTVPFNYANNPSYLAPMSLIPYSGGVAWAYLLRVDGFDNLLTRFSSTMTPLTGGDWPQLGLTDQFLSTNATSIDWMIANDRLHLLSQVRSDLNLYRARVASPSSSAHWERQTIASLSFYPGVRNFQLRFAADRPVAMYTFNAATLTIDPVEIYLARPMVGGFDALGDWSSRFAYSGGTTQIYPVYPAGAMEVLDDRIHLAYVDHGNNDELTYAIADGPW